MVDEEARVLGGGEIRKVDAKVDVRYGLTLFVAVASTSMGTGAGIGFGGGMLGFVDHRVLVLLGLLGVVQVVSGGCGPESERDRAVT